MTVLEDRAAVAMHEAGHAVVATRCGWPIRYVTLASRSASSTAHVKHPNYPFETVTWDEIAVSAAGPIAHDIINDCCDRPFIAQGSTGDFEHMRDAARFTRAAFRAGHQPERGLSRGATVRQITEVGWAEAYHRVTADWGAILAVTDALLDSRRALTGRDIRHLVEHAAGAPPPPHAELAAKFWPPGFQPRRWWTPAARERVLAGASR